MFSTRSASRRANGGGIGRKPTFSSAPRSSSLVRERLLRRPSAADRCAMSPPLCPGLYTKQGSSGGRQLKVRTFASSTQWTGLTRPVHSSAEAVAFREAGRRQLAGLTALADPALQVGLGPRLLAALPGQAVGLAEAFGVGDRFRAVQDHAAAARLLGHV